jgi:hypothetical protein
MKEGLVQEPVKNVARALASVALSTGGYQVGGIIAASPAAGFDVIEGETGIGTAVDTAVVVVGLD